MNTAILDDQLDPATEIRKLLEAAAHDYQSGRLERAQSCSKEIIADHPDEPDAWLLQGLIAIKSGQEADAIEAMETAISLRRGHAPYYEALGAICRDADRLDDARFALSRAVTLAPRLAKARLNLAFVDLAQGSANDGIKNLRQGIRLHLNSAGRRQWLRFSMLKLPFLALFRQLRTRGISLTAALALEKARILVRHGERERAVKSLRIAVELAPEFVPALVDLGIQLLKDQKSAAALAYLKKSVEIEPQNVSAVSACGQALSRAGRCAEAIEVLEGIPTPDRKSASYWLATAWCRYADNQSEEALELFEKANRFGLRSADVQYGLARTQQSLGNLDRSKTHLDAALAKDPRHARAFLTLAENGQLQPADQNFARLQDLARDTAMSQEDRSFLNFAAGTAYRKAGDTEKAFAHYKMANDLKDVVYSPVSWARRIDALIDEFGPHVFQRTANWGNRSVRPILIVGMPRSGTSLIEQILASHPEVFGGGELETFNQIVSDLPSRLNSDKPYPECVVELDEAALRSIANEYSENLCRISKDFTRVTDKMPNNFLHLGLVACALPNAKIIHCRRDPMDTCLSIYFKTFAGHHPYSYNLSNLGHYYREYERLMAHWREVLPAPILDVGYEEVVADQKSMTERMLDFCDLKWDDRCLQFYQAERAVKTASHAQVRQPIYKSAVARWKKFEPHLGALKVALSKSG